MQLQQPFFQNVQTETFTEYIPVEKKVIEYQTIKRKIQVPVTEEVIDYVPITTQETVEISPPRVQVQKETIPIIQQHVSFAQQRPQNIHPVPVSIRQPSPVLVKQSPRLITQTIPSPPRIQNGQFHQHLQQWVPQQRIVQNQAPPPQFIPYQQIQPQPQFQSIHQQLPPQIPIAPPPIPQQQFIQPLIPQQHIQPTPPIPQPQYQIPYDFQIPPPVPIPQFQQPHIQQPQYSQSNIIPNDPQYRPPMRNEEYQSENIHIHIPNRQNNRNERPDNQGYERHDNRHYMNQNQQPSFAESYPVQYDFQDDIYGEQRIQERQNNPRQQIDPRQYNQQNQRNPKEDADDLEDTYKYNSNTSNYTAQRNVYMPDYNRIPQNRELGRGVYSDRQPQYTQRTRKQQQDEYFRDKIFN